MKLSPIYAKHPDRMVMPVFNNLYIFNYFDIFAKRDEHITPILEHVEKHLSTLKPGDVAYYDKLSYLTFFKGVCLRRLRNYEEAIACYEKVIDLRKTVEDNTNLAPQACFEIAQIYRKCKLIKLTTISFTNCHLLCHQSTRISSKRASGITKRPSTRIT